MVLSRNSFKWSLVAAVTELLPEAVGETETQCVIVAIDQDEQSLSIYVRITRLCRMIGRKNKTECAKI